MAAKQFLHATTVYFTHPITNKPLDVEALLPGGLKNVLEEIKKRGL